MYSEKGNLHPAPPFSLAQALRFQSGFAPTQNEQALSEQALAKAVLVNEQVVAFRVRQAGTVEEPELPYTLFSEQPLDEDIRGKVLGRINLYLSLEDDLHPFYALGRQDPPFAPIIERLYGYHQVKFLSPFEAACWAILTQRNPMQEARKTKAAIARRYGGSIEVEGKAHWAFPEPHLIATAAPDDLEALIGNSKRAEYVTAAAWALDRADESFLLRGPYDEVQAWLRVIKGIGEWSATFIMLRGLGRMDRVPTGERRLLETASRVYGWGKAMDQGELERIAEGYGPWQGYWAHYLRAAA